MRRATAALHRRLDGAPDQRALLAPGITVERYASIMTRHHRALAASEALLAALEPDRPVELPPYRPRLPALAADLALLGAHVRATAPVDDLRSVHVRPPPTDADVAHGRYLGTRYVLEGSTLGAAVIARRLEQHLPALTADATTYWRTQAAEAYAWTALAGTLATLPAHGPLATAAIAAASEVFGAFLHAFGLDAPDARAAPGTRVAVARPRR